MKHISLFTIIVLATLITTQAAFGAARSWNLDKAHSNVYFTVEHIFSKTNGHFNDLKTEVNFDPANLAESRFYFEIKTNSIDTNISKRDKHLQSADFFDAGKFPLITFESKKITDAGNGVYDVAGTLTLKGEPYDFTLPLKLVGLKEHPAKKGTEVVGFNGGFTIDRLAHKVGNGKFFEMGIVGKEVDVLVTLELLSSK